MSLPRLGCVQLVTTRKRPSQCPIGIAGGIISHRLRRSIYHPARPETFNSVPYLPGERVVPNLRPGETFKAYRAQLRSGIHNRDQHPLPNHPTETNPFLPPPEFPLLVDRGQSAIQAALFRNDPDLALRSVLQLREEDAKIIGNLQTTTFHELLRLLDPDYAISPLNDILFRCAPAFHGRMQIDFIEDTVTQYQIAITKLISLRREHGHPTTFLDWKFQLKCAGVAGDYKAGMKLWERMKRLEFQPDAECLTYLLGSVVNPQSLNTFGRYRLSPGEHLFGRTAEIQGGIEARESKPLHQAVMAVLREARGYGIDLTETMYIHILKGFGRVGDQKSMGSILKDAWNIDTEAIMHQGQNIPSVFKIPIDSPLRPTSSLLVSIAWCYGACDNSVGAVRLIDYISRAYDLEITMEVWEFLTDWMYKYCKRRASAHERHQQLTMMSIIHLWHTMTRPPYNIQPSVHIRQKYVKCLVLMGARDEARVAIERGRIEFMDSQKEVELAEARFLHAYHKYPRNKMVPRLLPSLEKLRRDLWFAQLTARHKRLSIYRWMRWLFYGRRWNKRPNQDGTDVVVHDYYSAKPEGVWRERQLIYQTRDLPDIVEYWQHYLPARIWYDLPQGNILLEVGCDKYPEDDY
ncbi:MAG: hypothetical protein M1814_005557 [Vezdaea aestivalis]|nr:MAG: hypothetical protein M1814_005557 [Vezdaea aestivalis]